MAQSLSDTTKQDFKRSFNYFDKDKDGLIEKHDLASLMSNLKFYPSDSELDEMIGKFSDGTTDKIGYQDFLEMMATIMYDGNAEHELTKAFQVFDKEGRGVINAMQLREALSNIYSSLNKEETENLLHGLMDSDGNINYLDLISEFMFNNE